jgi:hypothetical protein
MFITLCIRLDNLQALSYSWFRFTSTPKSMIIDIHSHYVPLQSERVAAEIGKRHNLTLQQEGGRDVVIRSLWNSYRRRISSPATRGKFSTKMLASFSAWHLDTIPYNTLFGGNYALCHF